MNTPDWNRLQDLVNCAQGAREPVNEGFDPEGRRLLNALTESRARSGDIAGLIRTVLRSRSVYMGIDAELRVSQTTWSPTEQELRDHGMYMVRKSEHDSTIRARPWKPLWLEGVPDERVYRTRDNRFTTHAIECDPVTKSHSGFETYRSHGQATAVRAAATLPTGETLLVNLPTSAGKSLVFEICFCRSRPPRTE